MNNLALAIQIIAEVISVEEKSIAEGIQKFGIKKIISEPRECYQGVSDTQVERFNWLEIVFSEDFLDAVEKELEKIEEEKNNEKEIK